MAGATDNEGMWGEGGFRITQSRNDRQIKRLNFSQIKDTNLLNVGSITRRSHVGTHIDHKYIRGPMIQQNKGN